MPQMNDIGILIHGYDLNSHDWEKIVWGNPPNSFGRIAKGLQLAIAERARLIYWGSGSSHKQGESEAKYSFLYAVSHAGQLLEFTGFDVYEIEAILGYVSCIDEDARSLAEEIERASWACNERGVTKLILVSSPIQATDSLLCVAKLRKEGKIENLEVYVIAADL